LGLIKHQKGAVPGGQIFEAGQLFFRRHNHATGDHYGLGDDRRRVAAGGLIDQFFTGRKAGGAARWIVEVDRAASTKWRVDRRRIGRRQQRPQITPPGATDGGQALNREAAAMQAANDRGNIMLAAGAERHAHGDLIGL